jgi:hypothetical protein
MEPAAQNLFTYLYIVTSGAGAPGNFHPNLQHFLWELNLAYVSHKNMRRSNGTATATDDQLLTTTAPSKSTGTGRLLGDPSFIQQVG